MTTGTVAADADVAVTNKFGPFHSSSAAQQQKEFDHTIFNLGFEMLLDGFKRWLPLVLLAAATVAGGNPTPTSGASLQQCSLP